MNKLSVFSAALLLLISIGLTTGNAAAPVVSNVSASQRPGTKFVDIHYDLSDADGGPQTVQVQISADAGLTWTIPAVTLSGAVGSGVAVGNNKLIVWNAGADWDGQWVPECRARVTAHDGSTPIPPAGMVYIPAGIFQMGDSFYELGDQALPLHNVFVSGFFLDRTEVPKELWVAVETWAAANGYGNFSGNSSGPGHPVRSINWFTAVRWCNARSEKEGLTPCYYTDDAQTQVYRTGDLALTNSKVKWSANGYRLPTEAEWEKASRGGLLGQRFPWGDTIDGSQANYNGSGDPFESANVKTTPVGYYNGAQSPAGVDMSNGYGLYDMIGNVREWCWDRFSSTYYGTVEANESDPRGPDSGNERLIRGGAWTDAASSGSCRVGDRYAFAPNWANDHYGVRCVRGE